MVWHRKDVPVFSFSEVFDDSLLFFVIFVRQSFSVHRSFDISYADSPSFRCGNFLN